MCQQFWGKEDMFLNFGLENTIFLETEELRAAHGTLYVFRQYSYLQRRIDKFHVEAKKYRESESKEGPTHRLAPERASLCG